MLFIHYHLYQLMVCVLLMCNVYHVVWIKYVVEYYNVFSIYHWYLNNMFQWCKTTCGSPNIRLVHLFIKCSLNSLMVLNISLISRTICHLSFNKMDVWKLHFIKLCGSDTIIHLHHSSDEIILTLNAINSWLHSLDTAIKQWHIAPNLSNNFKQIHVLQSMKRKQIISLK